MRKQANPLKYMNPFHTLLSKEPTKEEMLKNVLGVSAVTIPSIALFTYLANARKMREMKKAINTSAEANVNGSLPILQPDDKRNNIKERDSRELRGVYAALNKQATGSGDGLLAGWGKEILYGTLPMAAVPLLTWLTAKGTNTLLKDKYADDLDKENKAIQDMQDKVDMDTLVRMGYLKQKPKQSLPKKANMSKYAYSDFLGLGGAIDSIARKYAHKDYLGGAVNAVGRFLSGGVNTGKKVFVTIPGAAMLLAALGIAGVGSLHFLKKSDDVQKLELLKKRMLGKDRLLQSPEISIEVPDEYEETGKKTAQLIPGISPALIPNNVVEDAQIVEKPKKDAFLG
jgi:hypothetical protein